MFTFIRCRIENPYNLPIVKDGRNIPSERFISVQSSSRKPRDKESNGNRGKERLTVYFLKGEPIDDDPEVVKEGEGNDHRPIVTETSRGIEDEGPIRGTRTKTFRPRLTRVTSATALLLLLLHRVPPRKDNQGKDDYAKSYQNDSSFFFLILTHRKRQEYVYFLDFENF